MFERQRRVLVPSAQYRHSQQVSLHCLENLCVALTRGLRAHRLHQCPEVSSSSQLATSGQVPLQGELFLCILQSANLRDTESPDTSCNQVFANRIPSSEQEH